MGPRTQRPVSAALQAAARINGRLGGRPPALSPEERERVCRSYVGGVRISALARAFRVGRATVYRALPCELIRRRPVPIG